MKGEQRQHRLCMQNAKERNKAGKTAGTMERSGNKAGKTAGTMERSGNKAGKTAVL